MPASADARETCKSTPSDDYARARQKTSFRDGAAAPDPESINACKIHILIDTILHESIFTDFSRARWSKTHADRDERRPSLLHLTGPKQHRPYR